MIEVAQQLQDRMWPVILNTTSPEVWLEYRKAMMSNNDPFAFVDAARREIEGGDQ